MTPFPQRENLSLLCPVSKTIPCTFTEETGTAKAKNSLAHAPLYNTRQSSDRSPGIDLLVKIAPAGETFQISSNAR